MAVICGLRGRELFSVPVSLPATLCEAILLRQLLPLKRPFLTSLAVNGITTVLGILAVVPILGLSEGIVARLYGIDTVALWENEETYSYILVPAMVIAWALSVVVEGPMLWLAGRASLPILRCLLVSLAANTASYALVVGTLLLSAWLHPDIFWVALIVLCISLLALGELQRLALSG